MSKTGVGHDQVHSRFPIARHVAGGCSCNTKEQIQLGIFEGKDWKSRHNKELYDYGPARHESVRKNQA